MGVAPRDAFPEYDEPVNIDMEPEDALRMLLDAEKADTERDEARQRPTS